MRAIITTMYRGKHGAHLKIVGDFACLAMRDRLVSCDQTRAVPRRAAPHVMQSANR